MAKTKAKRKPVQPVDATEEWIRKNMLGHGVPKSPAVCQWFALCNAPAVRSVPHPVLGEVPCCEKHARFAEGK